jgi:hypothetical protein
MNIPQRKNIVFSIKLFLFTVLSILIRGYHYGVGNQVHYFNFAFYRHYPGIYPDDYLFRIHNLPYTVFVDAINLLLNIFGENELVFFQVYVAILFLFYLAIYKIADQFFHKPGVSAMVLTLFIYPIPIGGSITQTVEQSLIPRFVAETLLLYAMYFIIVKKYILSSVAAAVGFLFHPLTIIIYVPTVLLNFGFDILRRTGTKRVHFLEQSWKMVILPLVLFTIISAPILFKFLSADPQGGVFVDPQWETVIRERLPYLYLWNWSLINYVAIAGMVMVFVFYRRIFARPLEGTVKAIVSASMMLFSLAFISALFDIRPILQLQQARSLYLLVIFLLICAGGSIGAMISEKALVRAGMVIVLLSALLCYPVRMQDGWLWRISRSDYQKAALWAKDHSSSDSLYLVPIDGFGFRFWSKRPVFLEFKEGGDSLYDRYFATVWYSRKKLVETNSLTDPAFIATLKNRYGIDYIVTIQSIPERLVYRNATYRIYKL